MVLNVVTADFPFLFLLVNNLPLPLQVNLEEVFLYEKKIEIYSTGKSDFK